MDSIILQGINTEDLRKIFREVLDEKIKKESEPKESVRKLPYLSRFEVAEILKISLPTLNNWSKSGIVQSYRIGNRVLYKAEEINQAIQAVKNIKYKRG
ncbi:MAG: helix-turn-helix domain-containing protein [Bacteroidales bacterium]|nr:helix-turn-helix domain-containing protein [Bacteroidales bacterium]